MSQGKQAIFMDFFLNFLDSSSCEHFSYSIFFILFFYSITYILISFMKVKEVKPSKFCWFIVIVNLLMRVCQFASLVEIWITLMN